MDWDATEVIPEDHLTLFVRFAESLVGKIHFLPSHLKGVFSPLKQADFSKKVFINHGVVTWPGEIDLAIDAMHAEIQQHGEWLLK